MRKTIDTAGSVPMPEKTRGIRIQERRLALGINSVRSLAKASGLARATVTNAEKGKAAAATYLVLEALLDRLEAGEPLSNGEPTEAEQGVLLFEIEGDGVRMVAHVPAGTPEELRTQVAAIIQGFRDGEGKAAEVAMRAALARQAEGGSGGLDRGVGESGGSRQSG